MGSSGEAERRPVARASSAEFAPAVMACDFPLAVWDPDTATVALANEQLAALVGLPLDQVVGQDLRAWLEQRDAVGKAVDAIRSGAVEGLRSERRLRHQGLGGEEVPVSLWTRTAEVDGHRAAITLLVPKAELPRLGRDPSVPWRDLAPVAVGTADFDGRVTSVSADIASILGGSAAQWVGVTLLDLVDPDDRERVRDAAAHPAAVVPTCEVRLRHSDGHFVDVCLLVAPMRVAPGNLAFAVVGPPAGEAADRVADLERRLRRIAAEVRAAGLLDSLEGMPSATDFPQLAELSTRQWEILERLLRGERVATIAKELFISQSTVRKHLAAIFRKFGVHSQDALIRLLRQPAAGES